MQWAYIRRCMDVMLATVISDAFTGCRSFNAILVRFQEFDELEKVGLLVILFVVGSGIYEIVIGPVRSWRDRRTTPESTTRNP